MIIVPILIILTVIALKANTFVRKHASKLYFLFSLLSLVAFVFVKLPIFMPFNKGFLGLSFFYIVMMAGALKHKSKLRISFMKIRKEYSIIGFIVITPHALFYLIQFLKADISIPLFGIIAYTIMIPLFITSFTLIRKKMSRKSWKTLQRFAYISYLGLLIHLILNYTQKINLVLYLLIFTVYIISKSMYTYHRYKFKSTNQ